MIRTGKSLLIGLLVLGVLVHAGAPAKADEGLLETGDTSEASRPIQETRSGPDVAADSAPAPAPVPQAREPWYSRAWATITEEAELLPGTLWNLPSAYWQTARSGQQISSLAGFVDRGTATMNPVGVGTSYGPLLGQDQAYGTGSTVGGVTGNVENTVLLASGIYGAGRAAPGLIRSAPAAAGRVWGLVRGGEGLVAPVAELVEGAEAADQTRRIYSARALARSAEEAGPYHNFPASFDEVIFGEGERVVKPGYFREASPGLGNDSINYTVPGHVNGTPGTYEIFARPSTSGNTEVITHRFFRPAR